MYSVIQGTKLCSLEALTYEDKPIRSLKWSLYVLFFKYKVSYYSTYCILCVYRRLCLCMYAYKKACTPIPPNSIYHYCSLHCTVYIKLNSMFVRVTHKYTRIHLHTHIHTLTCRQTQAFNPPFVTCTYTRIHLHAHAHTYTHTHTHAPTH